MSLLGELGLLLQLQPYRGRELLILAILLLRL